MGFPSAPAHILSGDWGTTRLRLRLVRLEPFRIVEEISLERGAAATHDAWKEAGCDRREFYLSRLGEALARFRNDLTGLPLYLSGMASSSVGIEELPYGTLPFGPGESLPLRMIPATEACPHRVTLLSGLRLGTREVMRGEETQVLGLLATPGLALPGNFVVILPGTHSKHVRVEAGVITGLRTYLTGDVFRAIAGHTILRHSIRVDPEVRDREAFREGVERSAAEPLLAALFGIRCADLFGERSAESGSAYLSGLLVGSELEGLSRSETHLLVAEDELGRLYLEALEILGRGTGVRRLPREAMAEAVPRAHAVVHRAG